MAFQKLPIEINQMIAEKLETDQDIINFRSACRPTKNAIDSEKHSFWRGRFREFYDPFRSGSSSPKRTKEQYQKRRMALRKCSIFHSGKSKIEGMLLGVLRDLISDSFTGEVISTSEGELTCRNMQALKRYACESGILNFLCHLDSKHPSNSLLAAIQVMLTHLSLDQAIFNETYGFPESQKQAYLSAKQAPIFVGFNKLEVNTPWLAHITNFFKYYMVRKEERNALFDAIEDLCCNQRPCGWVKNPGAPLGKLEKFWRGTYAFLERREIRSIREGLNDSRNRIFMDQHVDSDKPVQTMTLDFPEEDLNWPEYFEKHLNSKPTHLAAKTRAQHRLGNVAHEDLAPVGFQGSGHDDFEDFHSAGYISSLPSQHGISGWKRMTMMKYYIDDNGDIDMEALWAYEGVVLPGGRIILGRWWSPEDNDDNTEIYSGPFILWAVQPPVDANADGA